MKTNTIILIIATLLVMACAYWYFFTGTGNQPPLTTTATSENPAQTQFQALLSESQSIAFHTDIFSDPNFSALVDLATPVTPETQGRPDPFAIIPGVAGK